MTRTRAAAIGTRAAAGKWHQGGGDRHQGGGVMEIITQLQPGGGAKLNRGKG